MLDVAHHSVALLTYMPEFMVVLCEDFVYQAWAYENCIHAMGLFQMPILCGQVQSRAGKTMELLPCS